MIDVGPMSPKDALMLLEKKLGSLPDQGAATELVQALDFIPLTINQAAAYIQARTPRTSLEKYLAEFRESESSKSRLLQYDAGDLRRDVGASNAIFATWQISFDHIRSKRPSAANLLSLMSFFDRQGIPDWVLNTSNISMDAIQGRSVNETGDRRHGDAGGLLESLRRLRIRRLFHRRPVADKIRGRKLNDISTMGGGRISLMGYRAGDGFEDDIAMLSGYCLIDTTENGGTFEMHGLVQLSTRRWLEVYGEQDTFQQQFVERMAASYPTGRFENWEICRSLFAHAEVVLSYQSSGDTVETWARLLNNGGWYAWSQGRYDIAEQMLSKARKAGEKELGREDMATLETISLFALVQKDQGRWKEAESLFVQVMETFKRVLGEEHPSTLTSMANLASTYRNQGRWKEAESLEVQVMETSSRVLGEEHPDTLTSMANLASTYRNQGRWKEAEDLQAKELEICSRVLGNEHPDTLTSMANLAFTWEYQGRHSDALVLMRDCAEAQRRVFGEDHPNTVSSLAAVAAWSS